MAFFKRNQTKRKSESALDHLQRYTRRDYTTPKEEAEELANPDMVPDEQLEEPLVDAINSGVDDAID